MLRGVNDEKKCMCQDGVKFGIVRLDTCIDDVGGFPDYKIIHHHHRRCCRHSRNRHQQGLERSFSINELFMFIVLIVWKKIAHILSFHEFVSMNCYGEITFENIFFKYA